MDEMVYREIDDQDRMTDQDFASLFAQLCDDKAAPLDVGLRKLCLKLDELRRKDARKHH